MAEELSYVDLRPRADGPAPGAAETHLSVLFFGGDRAYKLYKPVDFGFVDASTLARRRELCRREVAVNRRFAPDVYLGVLDLTDETGRVHDHAVVMRRMPVDRRLAALVDGPEGEEVTRQVARRIAAIHASAPRPPEAAAAATRDAVHANWVANAEAMAPFVGSLIDPELDEAVSTLAGRYLDGREALFEQRIAHGFVVDGHGDLLAEDIFCLEDGPRVLDCLAFSDHLRHGDVLADVAFLAMDIERLAGSELARRFVSWYREFAGENHPGSLAHHYVAYRAQVRAKVACLRAAQGDDRAAADAKLHLAMCRRHLERARVRLVVVGGGPGTGKSTVSQRLGDAYGWTVLRSDEVRKERAGLSPTTDVSAPFGTGMYRPESTEDTYGALLGRAEQLLGLGENVVLDASWTSARWRSEARALADRARADLVELRCHAPRGVVIERIERRRQQGGDASDATADVARRLADHADPWPEATVLDTTDPVELITFRAIFLTR